MIALSQCLRQSQLHAEFAPVPLLQRMSGSAAYLLMAVLCSVGTVLALVHNI